MLLISKYENLILNTFECLCQVSNHYEHISIINVCNINTQFCISYSFKNIRFEKINRKTFSKNIPRADYTLTYRLLSRYIHTCTKHRRHEENNQTKA